ncbi:carboxylating nicotinate-nucleotide diphosphorylase [Geobacillus stearothermophilus]|uniref:Probable nicotinate-nucleotide pyrophosphorylase [carboxylating] n=2 Tax=Geobacillus TaxID=129337 RepID=A0A1Q5TA38_9BACL|nr:MULTISPECIES: carboxylating nicotinate-nucleotide diphosphorylase [Geobacillus]ALA69531.1 nicotinate-nucleotide pyrophosphorylase [Geobacillus stearothermophilus 10]ADU95014.1 nicotinate-nucleotide pyrophosphorylase [Geobacillus sp. Y412MC52]EPR27102.1 Nicotinate-nucleotide pyrophosphorylase [carboxylating] [Geobacillus sp. WSUCF1]MED3724310.1 carboxylating nicotinate-nucleotide diphosphorylase [Geobacillus stearothermophilus]MED3770247.1 carboxylating nicotinate-nucleotide diphosphorylase 
MNRLKLEQLLRQFFLEDIGDGDVTSETIFPAHERASGMFMAKADGVVAGVGIIAAGYQLLDPRVEVTIMKQDGERVQAGETIAVASGPVGPLLSGERVILNLLQRLSGIATVTRQAVDLLGNSSTRICDTRKTTPGLRMLEKYAVTCGGGYNHRFGLYDGVMIKDNHIAFCGSIARAVKTVRERLGHMVKIEVETETEDEVLEAVEAGADVIMFDNRTPDEVRAFVRLVPKPIITEASGGITLANVAAYGATGVDYISLGCLTHSAPALDMSFNLR